MTDVIEELSKKAKGGSETTEKALAELTKAISSLEKNLEDQIDQRKDNCRQIEEDISNEVSKFNQLIQKQRERRSTSDKKIREMMTEIKQKITTEIAESSSKRKKNNASILKLIEGACKRLEQKLEIVV